jgi:hypothetical protein
MPPDLNGREISRSEEADLVHGPPHVASDTPSSASSRATQFGQAMPRCARRAALKAPRTAPCALNARAFDSDAPLETPDARLAAGGTPSLLADSPLKTSGAWMPASGARPGVACARGAEAQYPRANCGGRSKRGGLQSVWLGVQGFLLGTPSSGTSRAKQKALNPELQRFAREAFWLARKAGWLADDAFCLARQASRLARERPCATCECQPSSL